MSVEQGGEAMSDGFDDLKMVLLYRDRSWSEVETPLRIPDGNDFSEWREVLHDNGWLLSTRLGNNNGISLEIYDRYTKAEPCRYRWLVEYNTSGPCQTIVIERWQDFIDFLAHVSSTMLVASLPEDLRDELRVVRASHG